MASEALCRGGKSDICVGLVGKLAEVAEQTKMFEWQGRHRVIDQCQRQRLEYNLYQTAVVLQGFPSQLQVE